MAQQRVEGGELSQLLAPPQVERGETGEPAQRLHARQLLAPPQVERGEPGEPAQRLQARQTWEWSVKVYFPIDAVRPFARFVETERQHAELRQFADFRR